MRRGAQVGGNGGKRIFKKGGSDVNGHDLGDGRRGLHAGDPGRVDLNNPTLSSVFWPGLPSLERRVSMRKKQRRLQELTTELQLT